MYQHTYSFEKLDVWQTARSFVKYIYVVTNGFPESEKYTLVSQLRRATVTIVSNIAEGSSRTSLKDQIRFTEIAYGSTLEVYCQLIIAYDLSYITEEILEQSKQTLKEISNKLNALKKSQQTRLQNK